MTLAKHVGGSPNMVLAVPKTAHNSPSLQVQFVHALALLQLASQFCCGP